MKSYSPDNDRDQQAQDAAYWLTRLLSGEITSAELHAYKAWLKKDVHNEQALNEMRNLWINLRKPLESDTHELSDAGFQSWHRTFFYDGKKSVIAVSLLLLITFLMAQWMNIWRYSYVTGTGEQKTWLLQDGTHMWLNTDSALDSISLNGKTRIKMIHGEAYFETSSEQSSPLTIEADNIIIKVFNSALNVLQQNEDTFISVDRGEAIVEDKNGREIVVKANKLFRTGTGNCFSDCYSKISKKSEYFSSWKNGNIIFSDQSLFSVIETVKRYEKRWIIFDSSSAKKINLSTVVDIKHLDAWYQQLGPALNVRVKIIGPIIWIGTIPAS